MLTYGDHPQNSCADVRLPLGSTQPSLYNLAAYGNDMDIDVPVLVSRVSGLSAPSRAGERTSRVGAGLLRLAAMTERSSVRRAALVIALTLFVPALFSGFSEDDYILLYEMRQPANSEWAGTPPFDLFRWTDPEHTARLRDGAGMP